MFNITHYFSFVSLPPGHRVLRGLCRAGARGGRGLRGPPAGGGARAERGAAPGARGAGAKRELDN